MESKICAKCGEEKLLDEFSIDKRINNGKSSLCKFCNNNRVINYYKKYPWKRTFNTIKQRCNNPTTKQYKNCGGRGIKCLITVEELKILWFRDKAFLLNKPSIDKEENNNKNYTFENCRYIEKSQNSARQDKTYCEKPINQYDLQGNFIRSWKSIHEAEKILKYHHNSNISQVCLGKFKQRYGFIWRFKNEK